MTPFLAMPAHFAVTAPLVDARRHPGEPGGPALRRRDRATRLALARGRARAARARRLPASSTSASPPPRAPPIRSSRHVVLPRDGAPRARRSPTSRKQFELDLDGLSATLDTVGTGLGGDPFGRTRSAGRSSRRCTRSASPARAGATLGGLAVDAAARVLDAAGQPDRRASTPPAAPRPGSAATAPDGALAGTDALAALGLARLAALDVIAGRLAASERPR